MISKKQRTTDFRNLMWKAFKPEWRVHTMNGRKYDAKPQEEREEILRKYAVDGTTRNFKCTNSPAALRRGIIAPVALKHAIKRKGDDLESALETAKKLEREGKQDEADEVMMEAFARQKQPLRCLHRQYTEAYIEKFDKYLYRRMVAWKKVRHKPDTMLTKEQRALKKIWKRYGWQKETVEEWFVISLNDIFHTGVRLPKSKIGASLREGWKEKKDEV